MTKNIMVKNQILENNLFNGPLVLRQTPRIFNPTKLFSSKSDKLLNREGESVEEPKEWKYNKGLWTPTEQATYIKFLHEKHEEMDTGSLRRSQKIFMQMSGVIKTRSADQCRSHHQKIIKYHHTIDEAIQFFSGKLASSPESNRSPEVRKSSLEEALPLQNKEKCETEDISIRMCGNGVRIVLNIAMIAQF